MKLITKQIPLRSALATVLGLAESNVHDMECNPEALETMAEDRLEEGAEDYRIRQEAEKIAQEHRDALAAVGRLIFTLDCNEVVTVRVEDSRITSKDIKTQCYFG